MNTSDKTNKIFFNVPIPLLKQLHTNCREFYEKAFDVGVYLCSKNLEGSSAVEKYNAAMKFLNVSQGKSSDTALKSARSIIYNIGDNYPTAGLDTHTYFDFYKNEKSDFEIASLAAFLGIKSIIGTKPYCKTNKAFIHARMFGYVTAKEMPSKLSLLEQKYQIRWHMDKILLELQTNWSLKLISDHQRGMYVSFSLSLEQLAEKSLINKQKAKIQQLRESKKKAIDTAKNQLTAH